MQVDSYSTRDIFLHVRQLMERVLQTQSFSCLLKPFHNTLDTFPYDSGKNQSCQEKVYVIQITAAKVLQCSNASVRDRTRLWAEHAMAFSFPVWTDATRRQAFRKQTRMPQAGFETWTSSK